VTRTIGEAPLVVEYVRGTDTVCPTVGELGTTAPAVIADVVFTLTVIDPAGGEVAVPVTTPAVAVTLAVRLVVSVVWALPVASVLTSDGETVPASAVKVTGTLPKRLPLASATVAVIVDVPPLAETVVGFAVTVTPPTAAAPMAILTTFAAVVVVVPLVVVVVAPAPPDVAVIVAVPDAVPALNCTMTRPLISVCACAGCTVPSVVVNVTSVPS
jgi:hypothetical protein